MNAYKIGDQILDENTGKSHGTLFQCVEVEVTEFFTYCYFKNVRKDGTFGKLTTEVKFRNS